MSRGTDREYVYGPDYVDEFVCQFDRGGQALLMLQDANYNVMALIAGQAMDDGNSNTIPAGGVVEQYTHEAYGAIAAVETFGPHAVSRVGHQGLFFDRFDGSYMDGSLAPGATGLYYNRNRSYSPTLGRFLQRDPNETAMPVLAAAVLNGESALLALPTFDAQGNYANSMNLYQYASSLPVSRQDPLGLLDAAFTLSGQMARAGVDGELRGIDGQRVGVAAAFIAATVGAWVLDRQWGVTGGLTGIGFDVFLLATEAFMTGEHAAAETLFRAAQGSALMWQVLRAEFVGKPVWLIIKMYKKASIMGAPLPPGGPGWPEILKKIWEEIVDAAKQGEKWAKTVKKLLTDQRFDK